MGSAVKDIGNNVTNAVTLGAVGNGPLGNPFDTLFGKQVPNQGASIVNTNSAAGMQASNNALNAMNDNISNVGSITNDAITAQENQARQGAADQAMKAQDLVAQHGLGDSSLGLGTVLNQSKGLGDQIGQIRAGKDMLQSNLLNNYSSGISGLMNAQNGGMIYNKAVQGGYRQGGVLAPITEAVGVGMKAYTGK